MPARALGAAPVDLTTIADRRIVLARWMTAPDNPYFARAIANRLWAHYFGRGLVEPLDDMRATNPATNEPLLDELAKHLREREVRPEGVHAHAAQLGLYQLASPTDKRIDLSHTYTDNGHYTLTVKIKDSTGNTASRSLIVNVTNVPPSVTLSGPSSIAVRATFTASGSFTDPRR